MKILKREPTKVAMPARVYLSNKEATISCLFGKRASVMISGQLLNNSVMINWTCFLSSNSKYSISTIIYYSISLFLRASFDNLIKFSYIYILNKDYKCVRYFFISTIYNLCHSFNIFGKLFGIFLILSVNYTTLFFHF